MSTTDANGVTTDIAGLPKLVGEHLGYTEWQQMSQERVNQFADSTDDHQFIHVDPERAKATPFGGTIAHGFLTLSLVAPISQQLLHFSDAKMGINYGLDRVRSRLRCQSVQSGAGEPRSSRSRRSRAARRSRCSSPSR